MLGKHLIKALSQNKEISVIYALVRNPDQVNVGKKVRLVKGDIGEQNLGLSADDLLLIKNVSQCYHVAAWVHLGNTQKVKTKLFKTNVTGTHHVLSICDSLPSLKHFYFISSAYACGEYDDVVPENWLKRPKKFRNFYEASKWECEELIKEKARTSSVHYMIYRPSILLDDAFTYPKHTVYLFCALLHKYLKGVKGNSRLKGNPAGCVNFVFAQDLVKFMLTTANQSGIYNYVNPNDTLISLLLQTITAYLTLNGTVEFVEKNLPQENLSKVERELNSALAPFTPYLCMDKIFWDQKNTAMPQKSVDCILDNIKQFCATLRKNDQRKLTVQI